MLLLIFVILYCCPKFRFALFLTTLAFELTPKPRDTAGRRQDPMTRGEWRVVAHVLKMSTLKCGAPVTFIVKFKSCDFLFHPAKSVRES